LFEVLDVLFGGLQASPVAWTSFMGPKVKTIAIFDQKTNNQLFFFFQFLVIKLLDPDSLAMLNPDFMNPDPQHCNRVNKLSLPEE
jgi:hypothetical protein